VPVVSFFAYGIAKNWVAGKSLADALYASKQANSKGFEVIVNYLGEEIEDVSEVRRSVAEYKRLLDAVHGERVNGGVSVKPTQLGLRIGGELFRRSLEEIVGHAARLKRFVWVDMESSMFTDDTLDVYGSVLKKNEDIGVCVQSYLRRSEGDLKRLVALGGKVRLVKGAYNEPASVAFKSKAEVDASFLRLMRYLFVNSVNLFSVSTHDEALVNKAIELSGRFKRNFEFGMLKGVRNKLMQELVARGFRVTEYIPYGENWLPYSVRRLREKPSNILLLTRSLLSR
jgi:proline dehydrogenase